MGKLGNVIECIEKAMLFAEGENERMVTIGYGVMEDALTLLKAQARTIEQFEREREQQMWNMPPMGGFHDD